MAFENGPGYIEPEGFPVQWDDAEEGELTWSWDDVHSPIPATPLSTSVQEHAQQVGAGRASRQMRSPRRGARKVVNGFTYSAALPGPPDAETAQAYQERMERMVRDARRRWDEELLPALVRGTDDMAARNLGGLPGSRLLEEVDRFLEHHANHWHIHMLAVSPVFHSTSLLRPLYERVTGSRDESEPYRLLQGFDNKSLEVDRELRGLARRALAHPETREALMLGADGIEVMQRLRSSERGREFLGALDALLETHGHRSSLLDLSEPTWREQPDFVLLAVKGLLQRTLDEDEAREQRLAAERERLTEHALERIGEDQETRDRFLELLYICQDLWPIREDHAYYIEQRSSAEVRRAFLECGRRLAADLVLDGPYDVFYLTVPEIREALISPGTAALKKTAQQRRVTRERFMRVTPPQFLGKEPPEGGLSDDSETSRFVRAVYTPLTEERPAMLRGAAGSPGRASGPARVVRSPEEFWRVRPGDILVARSTTPPWTPLFSVIGGLVTDSGGVLSHGAIVAREYRLPAAVGTKHATRVIHDGQVISVDGDAGIVRLH